VLLELVIPTRKNKYEALLLRKPMLFLYSLLLLAVNYLAPVYLPSVDIVAASSIESGRLIQLTNLDRNNAGLSSLKHNPLLDQAAYNKAQNMLQEDYWAHFGPNGETPWQYIREAGYDPYSYAGENLAKGFSTSEGVHQAWMASPTHKANIMDKDFVDVGYAVVNGYLQGQKTTLVVQMFGTLQSEEKVHSVNSVDIKNYESNIKSETNETGDITSIKIYNPKSNELVTSASTNIYGEVVSNVDKYKVQLQEGDVLLGTAKLGVDTNNVDKWEYSKDIDWEQGNHEVVASVIQTNGELINDALTTVNFTVDSVGPKLTKSSINEVFNENEVELYYMPETRIDNNVAGFVVVNRATFPFIHQNQDLIVKLPIAEYTDAKYIEIVLYDENSNKSNLILRNLDEEPSLGSVLGLNDSVGMFNLGFVGVLLLLLVVQIIQYMKLGLLQHKAHYLFTSGVFSMIILVAIFTKSIGSIG